MEKWVSVLKAADAAARWHVHQRRKGPAQEPYINHLLEVAMLVAEATHGEDLDLVIAALLHDAIEDCEVPKEMIEKTFGEEVASIVFEVSDEKSLPKEERKRLQIETASKKSKKAKILKLADKISNLRAILMSPATGWSVKRRIEYVEWARAVAKGLKVGNPSPWLQKEFDQAARAAESSFTPKI
jgi:GTP diphosphokinase / guanosine-3',5'-bis(diphosphate) 3'-diphosphatase